MDSSENDQKRQPGKSYKSSNIVSHYEWFATVMKNLSLIFPIYTESAYLHINN